MATIESTPHADGFRMPAEWEPHAATWMLWPQRSDNWRNGAKPAQKAWVEVASALARFEPVIVGVNSDQWENARAMLPDHIRVVEMANDDSWMRDIGPTFVVNDEGNVRMVHWHFNAWGGLYDGLYFPWDQDELVPRKMAEIAGIDRYRAPLVMEGGSIHVDGEGTVITTEECLLSPGRNPEMSREQIEQHVRDYLGVEKVIWLKRGIDPEETNGHVDDVACFVRPGVVLAGCTDDASDWRHEVLAENLEILRSATDAKGRALEVHTMPMPTTLTYTAEEVAGIDAVEGTIPREAGDEIPASYINFYLCNGGLLVPLFGDVYDEPALAALRELFPERKVVGFAGREIVLGGGNIHCITQQQPRG
ncbi:MAG TPA: agmatine deiminase [Coriobacteriia bacterium]|nr:agmatine deiminase [Coriobacteriia bacterium]